MTIIRGDEVNSLNHIRPEGTNIIEYYSPPSDWEQVINSTI